MSVVDEKQLLSVLERIRDLRRWVLDNQIDPWAMRQGLVIALALDTKSALARGIKALALADFDEAIYRDMRKWGREMRMTKP